MPARAQVLGCVGELPKKALSLSLKVDESLSSEIENVKITPIYYNVEENERVCTYLLMPFKADLLNKPLPVVIAIHQHGGQFHLGKDEPAGLAGDPLNHYGPRLCKQGYAVICPELLCFGDRRPALEIRQRYDGRMEAHGYENHEFFLRLLHGSTLQAKYLHDLSVTIDVIEKIPGLDSKRVAAFGHSLGGQEALWLSWFDKRIKAVISSCGICSQNAILEDYIVHNKAMYMPGLLNSVNDVHEIFIPEKDEKPVPIFISSGINDFMFPIRGTRYVTTELKKAYTSRNETEKLEYLEFEGAHEFPLEIQEKAFKFLSKWL